MERSEKWEEKNSPQQFPQWVLWQPGHLDSQGSPWAPYVHHETLGRTVHVGLRLFTTHTLPDTQATNADTQKHIHTTNRHTSNTGHTLPRHKYENAYINKHEFVWPNTHASTLASTGELARERERERESLMSYEGSRGQRESSVLSAVQPLKCHPGEAGNQLEHTSNVHTHTHAQTPLQSCEKMPTAINGALHNSCKSS